MINVDMKLNVGDTITVDQDDKNLVVLPEVDNFNYVIDIKNSLLYIGEIIDDEAIKKSYIINNKIRLPKGNFEERIAIEAEELTDKIKVLGDFIDMNSNGMMSAVIGREQFGLLKEQHSIMNSYRSILYKRLELLGSK